ncbi:MAG: DUF4097 family beta strand repeat-containing protein [Firmicutes bacterium]|nr:DUF4097 family beta strand repeat-containing protein [Bacillota bacterium]
MNKENKTEQEIKRMAAELVSDITLEREKQGLSQSKLAQLAGVKQSAVSRMESLGALPQLDTILRVMQPLNLKLSVKQKNYSGRDIMNIKNDNIKRLAVDTYSCRLNVTTSMDGEFHLVTDNENDFTLEQAGDAVVIRQKKRHLLRRLFDWAVEDVKITVPRDFYGEVALSNQNGRTSIYSIELGNMTVKNGNGMLVFEDINAGDIMLHNGNGRIEIQGAKFKSVDAHSGNGRLQMYDMTCEGRVKGKTSNGRIVLRNCVAQKFDFISSNGAIYLTDCEADEVKCGTSNGRVVASLRGNEEDYAIDFSTSNGSIYVGNSKYAGRYVVKSSGKKLEANTSNGSIRFRFADTPDLSAEGAGDYPDEDAEIFEDEVEVLAKKSDQ